MPKVGLLRSCGSGFLLSMPGRPSHDTTPHKRSLQLTILMRAICWATSHSPVASNGGGPAGWAKAELVASRQVKKPAQSAPFPRITIRRCCTRASLAGLAAAPGLNNAKQSLWFKLVAPVAGGTLSPAGGCGIDRFAYMPFGIGPRTCIGASFALQEASIVVAAILKNFTFEVAPGHTVWPVQKVTLRPQNGLSSIVKRR
jgi:hypothetical protein